MDTKLPQSAIFLVIYHHTADSTSDVVDEIYLYTIASATDADIVGNYNTDSQKKKQHNATLKTKTQQTTPDNTIQKDKLLTKGVWCQPRKNTFCALVPKRITPNSKYFMAIFFCFVLFCVECWCKSRR